MTGAASSAEAPTTTVSVVHIDARSGDDLAGDGTPGHPYQSARWARFRHGHGPIYALAHLTPSTAVQPTT